MNNLHDQAPSGLVTPHTSEEIDLIGPEVLEELRRLSRTPAEATEGVAA